MVCLLGLSLIIIFAFDRNELDKVDYVGKEFRVYPSMKYLEEHSLFNASDKTSNVSSFQMYLDKIVSLSNLGRYVGGWRS